MAIWDQCVTKAAVCRYLLTTNPGHSDDLHVKHPETLWLGSNFAPFAPPRTLRAHPGLSALPPPAPCASCKGIASPPVNAQNTMAPPGLAMQLALRLPPTTARAGPAPHSPGQPAWLLLEDRIPPRAAGGARGPQIVARPLHRRHCPAPAR